MNDYRGKLCILKSNVLYVEIHQLIDKNVEE